jgi:hypothetical protein
MNFHKSSIASSRRRLTPRGGRRGRPRFAFESLETRLALALHIENFSDDLDPTQPGFDSWDADSLTIPGGDTDADPNTRLGPDEFLIPHQTSSGQVFFLFREGPGVASFSLGISGVGDWYETNFAANRDLPGGLRQDEVAAVGIEFFGAGTILFVGENGVKTVTTRNWSSWDRVTVTSNDPSDSGAEMGPIERVLVTVDATSVPRGMVVDNIAVLVVDSGFSNNAPVANDDTAIVRAGTYREIDVLRNDTDGDHDQLTITNVTTTPGAAAVVQSGLIRYTPAPGYLGPDTFTYAVSDGRGGTDTATVSVSVETLTAVDDRDVTLPGQPIDIRVLENDSNPGDILYPLTIVVDPNAPILGTVEVHDGLITYTPDSGRHGRDTFTYMIQDDYGNSSTAIVTILVDTPPEPTDDQFDVIWGLPRFWVTAPGILANDMDADGDAPRSPVVISGPRKGTVVLGENGDFTYTPFTQFVASDSFTYRVSDGSMSSNRDATVTINVPNQVPVARDDYYEVQHGATEVRIPVLANDRNPDGDQLVATATNTLETRHGTVSLAPDGSFIYVPDASFFSWGTDRFFYKLNDGTSDSNIAEVSLRLYEPAGAFSIHGVVWNDLNGDGVRDAGEPGMPNIELFLDVPGGAPNRLVTTDFTGAYTFSGLEEGTYALGYAKPAQLPQQDLVHTLEHGRTGAIDLKFRAGPDGDFEDLVVGDFDANGFPDVAVVDRPSIVKVYRTVPIEPIDYHPVIFREERTISLPGGDIRSLVAEDLNQDGLLDLAVTTFDVHSSDRAVQVLLNDPSQPGNFIAPAVYGTPHNVGLLTTGDVDGDSFTDLIAASRWWRNNPAAPGTFLDPVTLPQAPKIVHDFNGDGRADFASIQGNGDIITVTMSDSNSPNGFAFPQSFHPSTTHPQRPGVSMPTDVQALFVGDFNRDGLTDFGFIDMDRIFPMAPQFNIVTLLNDASEPGKFQQPIRSWFGAAAPGDGVMDLDTGDFNGDGWLDVAVTLSKRDPVIDTRVVTDTRVLVSDPNDPGKFRTGGRFEGSGTGARHLAVADFDRDARLDIALVDREDSIDSSYLSLGLRTSEIEIHSWSRPETEFNLGLHLPPDNDSDNVSDATEDQAPNGGDGNNDGIPDSQQPDVTSLPTAAEGAFATLEVIDPPGAVLSNVQVMASPRYGAFGLGSPRPPGVSFQHGFLDYSVGTLPLGGAATVRLTVHDSDPVDSFWKFGVTPENPVPEYFEFLDDGMTGATISGNQITLRFVDGQRGDNSGIDGMIVDPGGPASWVPPVSQRDAYQVDEDHPLIVSARGVLANDISTTHEPLSALLVDGPRHGTITLHVDGSFTYTPNLNFNGTDSFSYRANDGRFDSEVATVTIVVNPVNDAPSVTISGPPIAVRGQPLRFNLSATDPEPDDVVTGFTYRVDWNGDGTVDEVLAGPASGIAIEHVFPVMGNYNVVATATDRNGAISNPATHAVDIRAVALIGSDLFVGGTAANDRIDFFPDRHGQVMVRVNRDTFGPFQPTRRLVAFGQEGNDNISKLLLPHLTAQFHGDGGNDHLFGGLAGHSLLVGGGGDDQLHSSDSGRNILIGGAGRDHLHGQHVGSNLLIGGTTAYDSNDAALLAILAEWTSEHDFDTRVANLRNGGGLNAAFVMVSNETVFDDGAMDQLFGGLADDWLFEFPGDKNHGAP